MVFSFSTFVSINFCVLLEGPFSDTNHIVGSVLADKSIKLEGNAFIDVQYTLGQTPTHKRG